LSGGVTAHGERIIGRGHACDFTLSSGGSDCVNASGPRSSWCWGLARWDRTRRSIGRASAAVKTGCRSSGCIMVFLIGGWAWIVKCVHGYQRL